MRPIWLLATSLFWNFLWLLFYFLGHSKVSTTGALASVLWILYSAVLLAAPALFLTQGFLYIRRLWRQQTVGLAEFFQSVLAVFLYFLPILLNKR